MKDVNESFEKCETCKHCKLVSGYDRKLIHRCVLNPPGLVLPAVINGQQALVVSQPPVSPKNDYCSYHKPVISVSGKH